MVGRVEIAYEVTWEQLIITVLEVNCRSALNRSEGKKYTVNLRKDCKMSGVVVQI